MKLESYKIGKAMVVFEDGEPSTEQEAFGYLTEAQQRHGMGVRKVSVNRDGDHADLDIELEPKTPFERIRRITGYLVGTTDKFNDGKRAEEHDRVKHGMEGTK